MLALFRALPLLWRVLSIVGVLAALCGAVAGGIGYIRHEGYVSGRADAQAECAAEKRKQEIANAAAIDAANRRLMAVADELANKELQLDDTLKAIDLATAEDPRGGDACLDPLGVRRLNSIR